MYPTLSVRGDHLLISRRHNYGNGVQVGDLVRFSHPSFAGAYAAKRVLGLPGDFVCKDKEYSGVPGATGEMVQVGFFWFLAWWLLVLIDRVVVDFFLS